MDKKKHTKRKRVRTKTNGESVLNSRSRGTRTSKIPYRTRHTKPLPNIKNIDEYSKDQLKQIIHLNRDKYGNPTHMGRPTDYKPEYDHMAYILLKTHGITIDELANALGTTTPGIKRWRDTYPNFNTAIIKGRDEFDVNVVHKSLCARATGYDYKETSTKYQSAPDKVDEDGKVISWKKMIVEQIVRDKHMAPDVGAICWFQKNRDPERWKDRKAVEISGPDGGPVENITANMDPKEAASIYSQLLKGKK